MLMSTVTDWRDLDDGFDPDTQKMPENPKHRRLIDAIGMVANHYVGAGTVVYRDMNWYPPDGGNAVAPDLMTLPAGALDADSNSYRQTGTNEPFPGVVVEVPSASDTYTGLSAKAARYIALGVDVYVVSTEPTLGAARRLVPGTTEFVAWTGKPIEPLGGLSIEVVDGEVMVRTPDGHVFSEDSELYGMLLSAERHAKAEAANAKAEAEDLMTRLAAAEAKLRALGA
jgi:Putative restriction endonuclease